MRVRDRFQVLKVAKNILKSSRGQLMRGGTLNRIELCQTASYSTKPDFMLRKLKYLSVDGGMMLKWILKVWDGWM